MTAAADSAADLIRAEANTAFKSGAFLKAAGLYTKALKEQPDSAVLYSNRSAALLKLDKVAKALSDAQEAIRLKPEWDKAWTRRAGAREAAGQREEALKDYEHALSLNASNAEVAAKVKALRQALGKPALSSQPAKAPQKGKASAAAPAVSPPEVPSDLREFLNRVVTLTKARVSDAGGALTLDHSVCFWPPVQRGDEEQMTQVAITHAFDSPEVLQECLQFLRQTATQQGSTAACAVIVQSKVAYPQVFKRPDWPLGRSEDGIFIQLDSLKSKQLQYFPYSGGLLREPVQLKLDLKLLEPLYR
mmetsp:Transcript_13705/g.41399  ORF Transcript_13705/g.41399 Transcript_13705/m.41399 type:complete len:304 (-) Transcript_13705:2114-3025(-)